MEKFISKAQVRWSDLDPNFHVLHSKYYDYAANCRMELLTKNGLSTSVMQEHHIGPILFREECVFKREIKFGDEIEINVKLQKTTADFGRWSMVHEIWKNKETISAIITVDGAWIDTQKRKLTLPPLLVANVFDNIPKSDDFVII